MNLRKAMVGRWIGLLVFMCPWTLSAANAPALTVEEQQWIERHPVVYFAANDQRPPLSYVENGVYKGLVAEYMASISRKSGLRFERYPTQAWTDVVKPFLAGEIDVLPAADPAWTLPELSDRLVYTEAYFTSPRLVVTRADEPVMLNSGELDGKVVSLFDTAATRQLMLVQFPKVKVLFTPNVRDALDAVADHRAYASIGAEVVLGPLLRHKYRGLLSISGALGHAPLSLHMAVRKDQPLLFSIIKKTLQSLSAQEIEVMQERSTEQSGYGAPTVRSWLRYYALEVASFTLGAALLAFFAWRAWASGKAAMHSERVKSRLLAMMNDDIRTPVHAILGSLDMLRRTPLNEQQQRFAHTASSAAEALLKLLDDVPERCKLEAGRLQPKRHPTDVAALVQEVTRVAEAKARDKNIPIHVTLERLQDRQLMLEPVRLRQLLQHLLNNAIKFTDQGQIDVDMAWGATDNAKHGVLSCSVTGPGTGIGEGQQRHLFNAYSQAGHATTRKRGSIGRGLAICKELVEQMEGTITFKSVEGVGTKVSFSVPASLAAPPAATAASVAPNAVADMPSGTPARILVVEDHPHSRVILLEQLKTLGVEPVGLPDGLAALAETARQEPALILMDCHLPGMDGYEATRRIRQREAEQGRSHVPIIAISTASDAQHLKKCMDSGMDGVLKKPLRMEELQSILQVWLEPAPDQMDEPTDACAASTDIRALYQASMAEDIHAIEQAVKRRHGDEIARYAHRIKGAALMLGAQEMADAADRLEQEASNTTRPESVPMEAMLQALKGAVERYFAPFDSTH